MTCPICLEKLNDPKLFDPWSEKFCHKDCLLKNAKDHLDLVLKAETGDIERHKARWSYLNDIEHFFFESWKEGNRPDTRYSGGTAELYAYAMGKLTNYEEEEFDFFAACFIMDTLQFHNLNGMPHPEFCEKILKLREECSMLKRIIDDLIKDGKFDYDLRSEPDFLGWDLHLGKKHITLTKNGKFILDGNEITSLSDPFYKQKIYKMFPKRKPHTYEDTPNNM